MIGLRDQRIVFDLGRGEAIQKILINRIEQFRAQLDPIQFFGQSRLRVPDFVPQGFIGYRLGEDQIVRLGLMLSVMLAFVLEYAQTMSLTDSPEREIEISPSRSPEYELDSPSTTHRKLAGR